jgi:hypothetical protein
MTFQSMNREIQLFIDGRRTLLAPRFGERGARDLGKQPSLRALNPFSTQSTDDSRVPLYQRTNDCAVR